MDKEYVDEKKVSSQERTWIKVTVFFSLIAMLISSYLIYVHYSGTTQSFCDIGTKANCNNVSRSVYSEFPINSGIPVAVLSIIFFLMIILFALGLKRKKTIKIGSRKCNKKTWTNIMFYGLILGLMFALYLVGIELFVIRVICILCVLLDVCILILLIASYYLRKLYHDKKIK